MKSWREEPIDIEATKKKIEEIEKELIEVKREMQEFLMELGL